VKPKLGFVGLGNIGEPICRNLLKEGYEVAVHDTNPEAVARLSDTGAKPVGSLGELGTVADVVLLSLPNSAVVEKVVISDDGLAKVLSEGQVLIDTSSSKPHSTRIIAQKLAASGVSMLDAPVSGGLLRAREGKLAVMIGGQREVFERYSDILRTFGEHVFYVGAHGTAHLLKALNNLLSATTLASTTEAVILAEKAGISPEIFIEVVNASSGRSYSTEVKFPRYILPRSFDDGFTLGLMSKDVKIALETAAEMEFPMLVGSTTSQIWQTAVAHGRSAENHTAIYAFMEDLLGK
jgi:3-hydroxyisobutyrate dehydrogenase